MQFLADIDEKALDKNYVTYSPNLGNIKKKRKEKNLGNSIE